MAVGNFEDAVASGLTAGLGSTVHHVDLTVLRSSPAVCQISVQAQAEECAGLDHPARRVASAGPGDSGRVRTEPVSTVLSTCCDSITEHRLRFYRNVHDPRALAQIFERAEAKLAELKHPDPYISEF